MSVISIAEVTPIRVQAVYDWLVRCPGKEEEENRLKHYLIPPSHNTIEGSESKNTRHRLQINPVLRTLEELGIIERQEERVKLVEPVIKQAEEKVPFRQIFSDFLFSDPKEGNKDFLLAVAWVLTLDPFHAPAKWEDFETDIKRSGCHELTGITNSVPYSNFIYWSNYLGFSWNYLGFVPDPSAHLEWTLAKLYPPNSEIAVSLFLQDLSQHVPVLDGGRYRDLIYDEIGYPEEPHRLSASLSLALKQLESNGKIELLRRSDTESRLLAKAFGEVAFSHVLINELRREKP